MDLNKRLSELRSFLTGILATKFHYLIILVIISGILVTLLIGRPDFTIRGLIYFIPGILVAIFLLYLYRKGKRYPDSLILLRADRKIFQILFVLLFILSLLAVYFSSYRPWYYFALITALFCVIFLQIFSDNLKPSGNLV